MPVIDSYGAISNGNFVNSSTYNVNGYKQSTLSITRNHPVFARSTFKVGSATITFDANAPVARWTHPVYGSGVVWYQGSTNQVYMATTSSNTTATTFDVQGPTPGQTQQQTNLCAGIVMGLAAASAVTGFGSAVTGVAAIFQPEFAVPAVGLGIASWGLGAASAVIGAFGPTGCNPFFPTSPGVIIPIPPIPDGLIGGGGSDQLNFLTK